MSIDNSSYASMWAITHTRFSYLMKYSLVDTFVSCHGLKVMTPKIHPYSRYGYTVYLPFKQQNAHNQQMYPLVN